MPQSERPTIRDKYQRSNPPADSALTNMIKNILDQMYNRCKGTSSSE